MRDVLIQQYFGVDLKLTWKVVQEEIPELKRKKLQIKQRLRSNE